MTFGQRLARLGLSALAACILFLLAGCQAGEGATLVLRDDGCLYQGPQGVTARNFSFTYNNQTGREDLAVVFATVDQRFSPSNLENYRNKNLADFSDQVLLNLPAVPGRTVTQTVMLQPGKQTIVACATQAGQVIAIVAVLDPR